MIVGYARTSSTAQVAGLEAQERDLRAAGCAKIFTEQVSSVAERQQLEAALGYVREGDTFSVTKLDRLPRLRAFLPAHRFNSRVAPREISTCRRGFQRAGGRDAPCNSTPS